MQPTHGANHAKLVSNGANEKHVIVNLSSRLEKRNCVVVYYFEEKTKFCSATINGSQGRLLGTPESRHRMT